MKTNWELNSSCNSEARSEAKENVLILQTTGFFFNITDLEFKSVHSVSK